MKWMKLHNAPGMADKRKALRKLETREEKILWEKLRDKRFYGLKFRRQHSVGGYILDFYCCSHRLAIELDGNQHLEQEHVIYDNARTEFLNEYHIRVIRFNNREIIHNLPGVLNQIHSHLSSPQELSPPPF